MKLPPIAFAFYLSLGTGRTYQRVAERFGVSRQAVARRALKDRWQDQVAKAEEKARQRAVQEATDSLESMNERHLKTAQLIQKKAIERLRDSSDLSVMEAIRALAIGIEQEREIRNAPGDQVIRITVGEGGSSADQSEPSIGGEEHAA